MLTKIISSFKISNVENIAKKGVNADFIILESPLKTPFLPPLENKQYTLVLDLDETLVHYQEVDLMRKNYMNLIKF